MQRSISTRRRLCGPSALFLVLLTSLGCDRNSATVSGRVTYKGEPLTPGDVIIYGANGKVESGPIGPDGNYMIHKAPLGDVKMAVLPSNPSQRPPPPLPMRGKKSAVKHPEPTNAAPAPTVKSASIPDRYKEPDKSGLNFTLKAGEQTINLDLTP